MSRKFPKPGRSTSYLHNEGVSDIFQVFRTNLPVFFLVKLKRSRHQRYGHLDVKDINEMQDQDIPRFLIMIFFRKEGHFGHKI